MLQSDWLPDTTRYLFRDTEILSSEKVIGRPSFIQGNEVKLFLLMEC